MQDDPKVRSQVTVLLERLCAGEQTALDELIPLVYGELRRIARSFFCRERPDHTQSFWPGLDGRAQMSIPSDSGSIRMHHTASLLKEKAADGNYQPERF